MRTRCAIMILLLGVSLNGIPTHGDQVMVALELPVKDVEQMENRTPQRPKETVQRDEPQGDERKEAVQQGKKEAASEAAAPKPSNRSKKGPLKDFVPSEKIPADQAVDFPTDI